MDARQPQASIHDALLHPSNIALIGASEGSADIAARPLRYLLQHKFAGTIYPIDRTRDSVQGVKAWRDLAALPEKVDHAFIMVGQSGLHDAVEACGKAGISVATLLADGFADAGPDGAVAQARLAELARGYGMRILGPNSLGVIVPETHLILTANAAFQAYEIPVGRTMLLSQSGNVIGTMFSRAAARDIGFAAIVSVGNEADLSIGEIGAAAAEDSSIDAFVLFLETLRHTTELARFAAKAHAHGKSIVVYKLGRSRVGQEAALMHTGAIAGGDAAADAFFRAHGMLRVDQLETLFELPPLLTRRRPAAGRATAVVTTTGGGGAIVADRLGQACIPVEPLDDLAQTRLASQNIRLRPGPLIDVTLAGTAPETMRAVLREALQAPNNDVVLAVVGASAQFEPRRAIEPIVEAAGLSDKPLAAFVVPDAPVALSLLAKAGIAAFRTPEAAADGLRAFLQWRAPAAPTLLGIDSDNWRPRTANRVLHEAQSVQIFKLLGIPIPTMLWLRNGNPVPSALPFPPPYVVKLLSPDLTHRSDFGGVVLDLETITGVRLAVETVTQRAQAANPDAFLDGVMIARRETGLAEVFLGFHRDAEAGPVVTLAMGGVMTEIYADKAVRLAPIDRPTAFAMIDEVKGLAGIRGYRNRRRGDLEALATAIMAFSSFALVASPRVESAEINPLLVKAEGEGVVALDGLIATD